MCYFEPASVMFTGSLPPNFRAHSHLGVPSQVLQIGIFFDGALAEEQELSRHSRRNVNLLHGNTEFPLCEHERYVSISDGQTS